MKIFDFNIHLPQNVSVNVDDVILDDLNLSSQGLTNGLNRHLASLKQLTGLNVLLFNQNLFEPKNDSILNFVNELKTQFEKILLTALIDFRMEQVSAYLDRARHEGVHTFMFNSYLQKIHETDFAKVLQVCKYAEANKIVVCIDASYGTSKMYTYDNLKLACFVADHITKVPIVIIHSGGYRVMEAMLLAMDKRNVFLDTSFSLNYYLGSSLEQDYAFAYKKLGAKRVLFGSDLPYLKFENAYSEQLDFFNRSGFSSDDLDHIFYKNSVRLVDGDW
jgi:uncharacterized protein